ncbi:hypothetical protein M422DRAFT_785813 [Sphaerobolus stellatus SS14]|uniref:F-box domain-containing protein n=1 Tax=Sphaerobolus stellatus (strain SS14) TaxID=990650 RepID=A0A0C9T6U1_SPHS4|nr:hypothetical protein M422DRAFT_785813 [Sphaerobolus stellatus SS14]
MDAVPIEFKSTRSASAPLLLTKICRRWRSVALKTPRLWSEIAITSSNGISQPLWSLFLKSSAARPLDILLISNQWVYDAPYASKCFLRTLNLHSERIISLITTDVRVQEAFPFQSPPPSSILEALWILNGYTTLPTLINPNPLE